MLKGSRPWPRTGGTTPFPNILIDRVMPHLTDTEWRVLVVVVRQTFGWSAGKGKRKAVDSLSHAQFKAKTGREGAAISRAIDRLVRVGLVVVRDERGQIMDSSQARRRAKGRLYFGSRMPDSNDPPDHVRKRTSKSENNKTKQYKIKQTQADLFGGGGNRG
jgi:hypothetical protein